MEENKNSWLVPVAIVICLLLIAGAVYYKDKTGNSADKTIGNWPTGLDKIIDKAEGVNAEPFRAIGAEDHLRGSANAPIKLVVYTDLECPACKYYHQQLTALTKDYVDTGKLSVIVRNFPLDALHPKARNEHLAAECVNALGGQDKYWQFIDKIFAVTPSNNELDPTVLVSTAKELGLTDQEFSICLKDQKYADKVEADVQNAVAMGAKGTPFSVIVSKDLLVPVYGAYPSARLASAIDLLLKLTETSATSTIIATTTATTTSKK